MATAAQIHANRLNALRSTGPRTEAGKAVSRFNALQFGVEARSLVIPGEDPAELEALALDYLRQFHPVGPAEDFLVSTLVKADWDRRRYTRLEGLVLQSQFAGEKPGAATDAFSAKPAQLVYRRLAAAERSYFRALKELRRFQKERLALDEAQPEADGITAEAPTPISAPSDRPAEPPKTAPEIGFVLEKTAQTGGSAAPVSPNPPRDLR
jgi:hypothetical protein